MTGQGGMAVLLIIALITVTSVTGAGPIPFTPQEEAQRDDATAEIANLPAEDQEALPTGPIPPIPPCECHAHGDVRYVTCDGRVFKYNTPTNVYGIMAKSIITWFWYVITRQEFFDDTPKTRLSAVKFKIFSYFVIVDYKKTSNPDGLYRITVGNDYVVGPIAVLYESLGPDTVVPGVKYVGSGFNISIIEKDGDWYIQVRCILLPPVLFDIYILVARHCLQLHIPPIWQSRIAGICGDWDRDPANDVVILDRWPQVTAPFRRFP
ncbi:uncharacterized protein LOC106181729 isoform X2 [Lingula anatina]|nr:uncharacterized protein LOC106181729 isoform X2 [Lingula anatina]|eukprot:XP_013421647.1 uncharacterized protein LOC106181729 isoform X2 [Lingula anatina]